MPPTRTAKARRQWLYDLLGAILLAASVAPAIAQAQEWPARPVTLVVPFPPGGSNDVAARVVAEHARKRLGQSVVVDNKPGANGALGVDTVLRAPRDHHSFLVASDSVSLLPLFRPLAWDLARTFTPVSVLAYQPIVVVTGVSTGLKSIKDLQERARGKPDQVSYASSGQGSIQHLLGELFAQNLGINLLHVPYKGGGQAIADTIGGSIPLVYTAVAGAQGHVKSGKLRAIAVSSARRNGALPDVPTFIESGFPDFVAESWVGILAPAKTPPAITARLNAELNTVLSDPALRERLATLGIEATPGTPEQFREQMRTDLANYGPIVRAAGIKLE